MPAVDSIFPALPTSLRIYPSQLALKQACTETAWLDDRTTFDDLFQTLGTAVDTTYLSPLNAWLLVHQCVPAATEFWVVQAYHRALIELRRAGITERHLPHKSLPFHPVSAKLLELKQVLHRYESLLDRHGFHDDADNERQAVLNVVQGVLPPWLRHVTDIHIEGGADLFGARTDLINAFISRGMHVHARIAWDAERAPAFAWPEAVLHHLEARGSVRLSLQFDRRIGDSALSAVRASQFTETSVPHQPVKVLHVDAGLEHARVLAAEVAGLINKGVPPNAICIAATNIDTWGDDIHTALAAYGIDAKRVYARYLNQTSTARLLLRLLALSHNQMPREDFIEVWLGLKIDIGTWSAERVATYLRRAGVRSLLVGGYFAPLMAQAERDALRPSAGSTLHGDVARVAERLQAFVDILTSSPKASPLATHCDWLTTLLAHVDFKDPTGLVLNAVDALQSAVAQSASHKVWSKNEFIDLVTALVEETELPADEIDFGSVTLAFPEQLVECQFDALVLANVNAGMFPKSTPHDPVLTEDLRAEINRLLGPRLLQQAPTSGRGALRASSRDTWLWLEALACAQKHLIVTYSTSSRDEDVSRSELVDELLRSTESDVVVPAPSYAIETGCPALESLVQYGAWKRVQTLNDALTSHVPAVAALQTRSMQPQASVADVKDVVAKFLAERVHSTSSIDTLGMCAFRYYANFMLGLRRDDVPVLGIDAREEGSIAHRALELVYRDIIDKRIGSAFAEARRQPELTLLRARQLFDASRQDILREVSAHPLLVDAACDDAWSVVETQLRKDLQGTHEPVALEYGFDDRASVAIGKELSLTHPTTEMPLRIRGSIDRIDVEGKHLIALDYKRTLRKRQPGRHFQLPVYGAVAWRDFSTPDMSEIHAAWVGLRDAKRKTAEELPAAWSSPCADASQPDLFHQALNGILWPRVDRIASGDISPDPDSPDLCTRCDFLDVCRRRHGASQEASHDD